MIKITFHISEIINVGPEIIIERIASELNKPGYIIKKRTTNNLEFENTIWQRGTQSDAFGKIDGGQFNIDTTEKKSVIYFSYYLDPSYEILLITGLIIWGFIKNYTVFFLLIPLLLIFSFRIINVKSVGRIMIRKITNP